MILGVRGYQWTLGWVMGGRCRFMPTCSAYAIEALQEHGALRGGWMAARRVLRCHPWGGSGWDPVARKCGCGDCGKGEGSEAEAGRGRM
ncbi:MAG: membrane protein insertion efficiency factor YidD [Phycisphaerales bacterium]